MCTTVSSSWIAFRFFFSRTNDRSLSREILKFNWLFKYKERGLRRLFSLSTAEKLSSGFERRTPVTKVVDINWFFWQKSRIKSSTRRKRYACCIETGYTTKNQRIFLDWHVRFTNNGWEAKIDLHLTIDASEASLLRYHKSRCQHQVSNIILYNSFLFIVR